MSQTDDPYRPILAALKAGQSDTAARLATALVRRQAGDARAHALHARVLAAQGQHDAARDAAERALRLDPAFVPAHIERAALARLAGDHATAARHLRETTRLAPTLAEGWFDLGMALEAGGQADAADAFAQAARLQPGRWETWLKLGRHDFAAGRFDDALQRFGRAAELAPQAIETWLNLGETFLKLERHSGAANAYQRATQQAPDDARAWDGYVRALRALDNDAPGLLDAALNLARVAGTAEAYTYLAMQRWRIGRVDEAREAFDEALRRDPAHLPALWGRFQYPASEVFDDEAAMAQFRDEWRDGLARFEQLWPDDASPGLASSCVTLATNFYLHYLGQPFVDEQRRYGALLQRMMQPFTAMADAAVAARPRDGRRRVGILTAFVRRHTVMKLFERVITGLAEAGFEVSLFHPDNKTSDVAQRLATQVDFYATRENSLAWWVDTIRARELDVLLFLDIGMHPIAQALAALRFAPVQAALWGHPVTTGMTTIDCFLTADAMEVLGGEANYTERVVHLPRLGTCYATPHEAPQAPADFAPAADEVPYFFGQSAFKILPVHDEMLARLKHALPAARVHMTPHPNPRTRAALRDRMTRHFAGHGLAFDDVVGTFRYVTEAEFTGIAARATVNLDSLGWSGGNTTLEILWHDVPTVTLPGPLMRSRHTYAMLKLLELDELIANDLDDYVRIAAALGRSPDWRAEVSGKIRERKHRLYEDRSVIDAIAAFVRDPGLVTR